MKHIPAFIARFTPPGTRVHRARFRCFCGNEFEAIERNVKVGRKTSCGCLFPHKTAAKRHSFPSPDLAEKLVRMATSRRTQVEISVELGMAQSTVGRLMRRFGIPALSRSEGRLASMARRNGEARQ